MKAEDLVQSAHFVKCQGQTPTSLMRLLGTLARNFVVGKFGNIGLRLGMLDRHPNEISIFVQIDQDVFIDVLGLRHSAITEFEVCRIRVWKVSDFHDSPPEQAIKERIVDGFSVLQQDHPKKFSSSLLYPCPPSDPPVALPFFVNRVVHSELDLLIFDHLPVGTIPHKFEIVRCFHLKDNSILEGRIANPAMPNTCFELTYLRFGRSG